MKRNEILSILLDELLEEIKERKEINKLKRKQILSITLDELLEKVVREQGDLKEYLAALSYIENVIAYFNYIVEKDGEKNENRYYDKQKSM